jgi:type II secretion system protein N
VKEKLVRALKWCAYPAFYLFALLVFGYLTFPVDRLKDRILSEIAKQWKGGRGPVVTIDKLDSYWISGVAADGVKVRLPADERPGRSSMSGGFPGNPGFGGGESEPAKDSTIDGKEAHARARLLPLLIGRVQLDFWASVFGGEVSGTLPVNSSKGDVELMIEELKLSEVEPLQNLLGIPIDGKVNGALSLSPTDGKLSKASGKVDVSIKSVVVSDGKTKIQGLLALPPAKVEEIVLSGEAEKGNLKITKLSANGPDLELEGDGKATLREPLTESTIDIYVKFRFTDAYRGKDATTKSILGDPGSSMPGIIDQVPKLKRAKRADGFYGFHIKGRLKSPSFEPSPTDASGSSGSPSSGSRRPGRGTESMPSPLGGGKKVGGVTLPLGASSAMAGRDKPEDKPEDEGDKRKPEEKKEEVKEEKKEEKPEDKPSDRQEANPGRPAPVQEPEPPVIIPPGEVPGGDPRAPNEPRPDDGRPNEEPR